MSERRPQSLQDACLTANGAGDITSAPDRARWLPKGVSGETPPSSVVLRRLRSLHLGRRVALQLL